MSTNPRTVPMGTEASAMAGADELPVATTILGAPARYFVPAVAVGLGFALGVSLVAGIVFRFLVGLKKTPPKCISLLNGK